MSRRITRIFGVVLRVLGLLVGVPIVLVLLFLVVLSTGLVNDTLRDRLERELSSAVIEEVSVGALKGSLLDRVELTHLAIGRDRPLLRIEGLVLDFHWMSLLAGRLSVDELSVVRVEANVHSDPETGEIDLFEIINPAWHPPDVDLDLESLPLDVEVKRIALENATIRSFSSGSTTTIDGISLLVRASIEDDRARIDLDRLRAGDGMLDLSGSVVKASGRAPWSVALSGILGGGRMSLESTTAPDLSHVALDVRARTLDLGRVLPSLPRSELDLDVNGDMNLARKSGLSGDTEVSISGSITGPRGRLVLDGLKAEAHGDNGRLRLTMTATAGSDRARARASLRFAEGNLEIEEVHAKVEIDELALYAPPEVALTGSVDLDVTAKRHGRTFDLAAEAKLRAIAISTLRLKEGHLHANAREWPERTRGDLVLVARELFAGSIVLPSVKIEAATDRDPGLFDVWVELAGPRPLRSVRANIDLRTNPPMVSLSRLTLRTPTHTWRTRSGSLSFTPKSGLIFDRWSLGSSPRAGSLLVDGAIDPSGKDIDLALALSAFELAQLGPFLSRDGSIRDGRLDATLKVGLHPDAHFLDERVRAAVSIRSLGVGGGSPLDLDLALDLANRAVLLRGEIVGSELGRARFDLASSVPGSLFDPKTLSAFGPNAVRRARLVVSGFSLGEVLRLADRDLGVVGGVIDADLAWVGRKDIVVTATAAHVRFGDLEPEGALRVWGRSERRGTILSATVDVADRRALALEFTTELGLAALSEARLRRVAERSSEASFTLRARMDRFSPALVAPHRLTGGEVSMSVDARRERGMLSADVDLDVRDLRLASSLLRLPLPLPLPIEVDATARLDGTDLRADGTLGLGALGQVKATARLRVPSDRSGWTSFIDHPEGAVEGVDVDLTRFELSTLSSLGLLPADLEGRVTGKARLSPGVRGLSTYLRFADVRPPFMQVPIDAVLVVDVEDTKTTAELGVFRKSEPFATVEARALVGLRDLMRPDGPDIRALLARQVHAQLVSERLSLERLLKKTPVEGLASGSFDIQLLVDGPLARPRGKLEVTTESLALAGTRFETFALSAQGGEDGGMGVLRVRQVGGGDLEVRGDLDLDRAIAGRVSAKRFRVGFLSRLLAGSSAFAADGDLDAALTISGTLDRPRLEGGLRIEGDRMLVPPPLLPFEAWSLDARVDPDRLKLELSMSTPSKGTVSLNAEVGYPKWPEADISARLRLEDLPVAAGSNLATVDLGAGIEGRLRSDERRIAVRIDQGLISLLTERADRLRGLEALEDVRFVDHRPKKHRDRTPDSRPASKGEAKTERETPTTIELSIVEPVPIRGDDIDAAVAGGLELETSPSGPRASGVVSIDQGFVQLFDRRWEIHRARAVFAGELVPRIDVELAHTFNVATVVIGLQGRPDDPELVLSARPPIFDQAELLGIVLGGDPDADPNGPPVSMEKRAMGAAAGLLVGPVTEELERRLPIDSLKLDLEEGSRAQLTLGKWITRKVFVAYRYRFDPAPEANSNEALLQYRFLRGFLLEVTYGDRDRGGGDLYWVKRF